MKINLEYENDIVNDIANGELKAIKLIKHLVNNHNFTTDKPIEKTAIQDLRLKDCKITNARLDIVSYKLHISLGRL